MGKCRCKTSLYDYVKIVHRLVTRILVWLSKIRDHVKTNCEHFGKYPTSNKQFLDRKHTNFSTFGRFQTSNQHNKTTS